MFQMTERGNHVYQLEWEDYLSPGSEPAFLRMTPLKATSKEFNYTSNNTKYKFSHDSPFAYSFSSSYLWIN